MCEFLATTNIDNIDAMEITIKGDKDFPGKIWRKQAAYAGRGGAADVEDAEHADAHNDGSNQAEQGSLGPRMPSSSISDTAKSTDSNSGWRVMLEEGLAAAEDPHSRPIPIYTPDP